MKSRVGLALFALSCVAGAVEPLPPAPALLRVRRIYVEQLGGGAQSDQLRDMIIAAIQNSKIFLLTDNPERADAILRGSADDRIFNEDHTSSDSVGIRASIGTGTTDRVNSVGTTTSRLSASSGITDSESSHAIERRHEASASLRLVDTDGDIIWSTTQESGGGKFRGAMADVADKVARQLAEDTRKARETPQTPPTP